MNDALAQLTGQLAARAVAPSRAVAVPGAQEVLPPVKPFGRPTLYKPAFCALAVEAGTRGLSPAQIAAGFDVAESTIYVWSDKHADFKDALSRARTLAQAHWEAIGYDALGADRFQAKVWDTVMKARWRETYAPPIEVGGLGGAPIELRVGPTDTDL